MIGKVGWPNAKIWGTLGGLGFLVSGGIAAYRLITSQSITSVESIFYASLACLGLLIVLIVAAYEVYRQDTALMQSEIDNRQSHITSLEAQLKPFVDLETEQRGHEGGWLYPIVELIDIDRGNHISDEEITVKFQFDSGLLYDYQPSRLWVSLVLGGVVGDDKQHEILQSPNFLRSKRSQLASIVFAVKDKATFQKMLLSRQGDKVQKELLIIMQLANGQMHSFRV